MASIELCICIFRCEVALTAKVPIDPAIDGGHWQEIVTKKAREAHNEQAPILPITGWLEFPSSGI